MPPPEFLPVLSAFEALVWSLHTSIEEGLTALVKLFLTVFIFIH
jgi:hypothetical protein